MREEHKCPICGEVTSSYMGNYRKDGLCKEHAYALKWGELEKNDNGNWVYLGKEISSVKKYFTLPRYGFGKCQICGERTVGPAFCLNCYREFTNDELLNALNDINVLNKLKQKKDSSDEVDDEKDNNEEQNETDNNENKVVINADSKSKCITCGRSTDGLLFCSVCYKKYKDKELLFRITKCTDVELLDSSYEGKHVCVDGHVVKSKSEYIIDNYLFSHGISHAYEHGVSYGPSRKEMLYPDFYLPNYLGLGKHVYIEHWGFNDNNIDYKKTKKFKIEKYKEMGLTLVCTHETTDMKEIDSALDRKLNKNNIKINEINFENEND